jgi:trigger factor
MEDLERGKKGVNLKVTLDELAPNFKKAYDEYRKKIVIQGFRRGKAPINLVKQMFGKTIRREAAEKAIPELFSKLIVDYDLKLVAPAVLEKMNYTDESGLMLYATLTVEPEFDLIKITGFEFEKLNYQVDDETMQAVLENIRQNHAIMNSVDRPAQEYDYVQTNLQKTDNTGLPIIGNKLENYLFHILPTDQGSFALTQQFIGAQAGEKRRVFVVDSHHPDSKEERTTYYEATIKEIKSKVVPELNDDFAKELGEFTDLEDFKKKLQLQIEFESLQQNHNDFFQTITDEIVKSNPIELTEIQIETTLNRAIESWRQKNPKKKSISAEELRESLRPEAIWQLKWRMIGDKIIEMADLKLTDDDYERRYQAIATGTAQDLERIRNRYINNEDSHDELTHSLLQEAIIDYVVRHSVVTEKSVSYQTVMHKNRYHE